MYIVYPRLIILMVNYFPFHSDCALYKSEQHANVGNGEISVETPYCRIKKLCVMDFYAGISTKCWIFKHEIVGGGGSRRTISISPWSWPSFLRRDKDRNQLYPD